MSEPDILGALGSITTEKILKEHPLVKMWSFNETYIICLDVETDVDKGYYPRTWSFKKILGYYNNPHTADDAMKAFIKSEKFKALEEVADTVYVYKKAVSMFDFDAAYSVVDDVIDQVKELKKMRGKSQ